MAIVIVILLIQITEDCWKHLRSFRRFRLMLTRALIQCSKEKYVGKLNKFWVVKFLYHDEGTSSQIHTKVLYCLNYSHFNIVIGNLYTQW